MVRIFDYANIVPELFTPEVVNLIAAIHKNKGKQDFFIVAKSDILSNILDIAKVQSNGTSNKIEVSLRLKR